MLDVGAGDGYVAHMVASNRPQMRVVCCDINYADEDLQLSKRGVELVRTPPEGRFDVLLLLDVIEHVEDTEPLLRDLMEYSAHRGSVALVTVPAHPRLFSEHDSALGHFRRYTSSTLRSDLSRSGWLVREAGAFYTLPLLARVGQKLVRRSQSSVTGRPENLGDWRRGQTTTRAIAAALGADAAANLLMTRMGLPTVGLSLWALAVPDAHA